MSDAFELSMDTKKRFEVRHDANGRPYYFDIQEQTSGYLPTLESESMMNELPPGYELRHDKQGRQYYVNHNDETTSYMNPNRRNLKEEPTSRHDACVIQKTIDGSEFVVDYAANSIVGPVHDRKVYFLESWTQDGQEYVLRIHEGKVYGFFPRTRSQDGIVQAEAADDMAK
ncbi:hypothetical protein BT63DRAFT_1662 [Microthyrium microscopicum]|uniref:WW domain-containing protein n=1 Tax=Microthyrium microscopicum TaxID=703497 RepID=A0A6A6URI3_9PEZI|nr:hypothetical protein BT63DRAFT_1662 [Microthyrium microscopicum]